MTNSLLKKTKKKQGKNECINLLGRLVLEKGRFKRSLIIVIIKSKYKFSC